MTDTVIVAAISTSGSALTAVVALLLNYRLFNSLERRLEVIEKDIKEWAKIFARLDTDIARLKDHTGLKD